MKHQPVLGSRVNIVSQVDLQLCSKSKRNLKLASADKLIIVVQQNKSTRQDTSLKLYKL